MGNILTWQQQTDTSTPSLYTLQNDNADQLLDATLTNTSTQATIHRYAYNYDSAGNRKTLQIDNNVNSATVNNVNQILSTPGGGTMRFAGTLNEAATVTGTSFVGSANVQNGINNVSVSATDAAGHSTTNTYQVNATSNNPQVFTYDANGNTLSDGVRSYTWDAANRLVGIQYVGTTNATQMTYDGLGRRVGIVESTGGTVTSTKQFVRDRSSMAEERDADGNVTKRFYGQGEQISGTSYYYTRDHLGSVREMTDGTGAIQARYSYDPYGVQTQVSGSMASDFQYGGYHYHAASGLDLTLYRAYNASIARWLSVDPIGESGGINLYGYVENNPVRWFDKFGLNPRAPVWWWGLNGIVYNDFRSATPVPGYYLKTTPQQDNEAIDILNSMVGEEGPYRLTSPNCRTFSQEMFNIFKSYYGKR